MSILIKQTVVFKTSPHELYEALMDSSRHAAFTQNEAEISREVGGEFQVYGGYITGKNLEIIPDQKIVQSWRVMDWPEEHFSTVTLLITQVKEGALLEFSHTGVPEGLEEEFSQGWIHNYWEPMKVFLEK